MEWTELDEILYREFKFNIRKPIAPIMKKHNIQRATIKEWLKKVPEYCDIFTYFYPASISAYDPYIFIFETNYEDFIIDVFSQLPTSALFFKIKDKLIARLYLDRQFQKNVESDAEDLCQMNISSIMEDLLEKNIIKSTSRAFVAYCWRKNL